MGTRQGVIQSITARTTFLLQTREENYTLAIQNNGCIYLSSSLAYLPPRLVRYQPDGWPRLFAVVRATMVRGVHNALVQVTGATFARARYKTFTEFQHKILNFFTEFLK